MPFIDAKFNFGKEMIATALGPKMPSLLPPMV
jgi:hypothetical protein